MSACRRPHLEQLEAELSLAQVVRGPPCDNNEDVDDGGDPVPSRPDMHQLAFSKVDGMNFVSPGRQGNGVRQVQVIVTEVSTYSV